MLEVSKIDKKTNAGLFFWLLVYKTTIELVYIYFIAPKYGYSGLYFDADLSRYFISNIAVITITFFAPKNLSKPSAYLWVIFVMTNIIPALSYYWLSSKNSEYVFILTFASVLLATVLKYKLPTINIKSTTANIWLIFTFTIYLMITILLVIQRGGIDSRAFDFDLIYELRSETDISTIQGYLLNWSTKALAPFFFVYFYYYKKKMMLMVVVFLQLLMYLSFGNKAFLFSIGVLILMTKIIKRGYFVREYILSLSVLNVVASIIDTLFNIDALSRAIPYRLVFIPAQIQYQYYDFFKGRGKLLFADGLLGKLFSIKSPFGDKISEVIGMYYSHNGLGTNANTGMISDAYANGGIFGVIIITLSFGIILLIIDSSTAKLPLFVVISSLSYITFVLNDTGLLTTFLTGGMAIMILLLIMFNSCVDKEKALKRNITNHESDANKINS